MSANDRQEGGEHYKRLDPEPWDIVHAWGLDFYLGNAQKYIARAAHRTGEAQELDLKKAIHYLEKKLELVKESEKAYREGQEIRSVPIPGVDEILLQPAAYSKWEGHGWEPWPSIGGIQKWFLDQKISRDEKRDQVLLLPIFRDTPNRPAEGILLHAMKFSDGRIWDSINGWRDS